jgi:hypothetical protein
MKLTRLTVAILGASAVLTASVAIASHTWNNYHWARTTSSFNLQVVDSNTSDWDDELGLAASQWSQSNILNLNVVAGSDVAKDRKRCSPISGKVRSCNASYGNNGWLGLASINLDSNGHIIQGTSKMNDSYSSYFASQDERRHVMCQELGHTFGLGHTSEDGSSQNTCMDYSQSSTSTAPNSHDYAQLASQYSHLDSYNSYSSSAAPPPSNGNGKGKGKPAMAGVVPMGMRVRANKHEEIWVAHDGNGGTWVHHVTLAPGHTHSVPDHD